MTEALVENFVNAYTPIERGGNQPKININLQYSIKFARTGLLSCIICDRENVDQRLENIIKEECPNLNFKYAHLPFENFVKKNKDNLEELFSWFIDVRDLMVLCYYDRNYMRVKADAIGYKVPDQELAKRIIFNASGIEGAIKLVQPVTVVQDDVIYLKKSRDKDYLFKRSSLLLDFYLAVYEMQLYFSHCHPYMEMLCKNCELPDEAIETITAAVDNMSVKICYVCGLSPTLVCRECEKVFCHSDFTKFHQHNARQDANHIAVPLL